MKFDDKKAWIDYDLTGYQNFIENPKSTGCVFMTPTGQWDRMPCDKENGVFCSLRFHSWQVLIIFFYNLKILSINSIVIRPVFPVRNCEQKIIFHSIYPVPTLLNQKRFRSVQYVVVQYVLYNTKSFLIQKCWNRIWSICYIYDMYRT